jgi:hypothetical protein
MKCLNALFENEAIQTYVDSNEKSILESTQAFHEFPETVKNFVVENLSDFIGDDVEETYENIKTFAENSAFQYLHELSSAIAV